MIYKFLDNHNVAQPRILLNSSIGISILSLVNVSASDAGVYVCSVKNFVTNNVEIQVSYYKILNMIMVVHNFNNMVQKIF